MFDALLGGKNEKRRKRSDFAHTHTSISRGSSSRLRFSKGDNSYCARSLLYALTRAERKVVATTRNNRCPYLIRMKVTIVMVASSESTSDQNKNDSE